FDLIGSWPIQKVADDMTAVCKVLSQEVKYSGKGQRRPDGQLWRTRTTMADRVRWTMEAVIKYAGRRNYCQFTNNPADEQAVREAGFPDRKKIAPKKDNNFLHYDDMPAAIAWLTEKGESKHNVLKFAILTASRLNEAREAKWEEFKFEERIWTVPGGRFKTGQDHEVPLTDYLIRFLNGLPREKGNDYVFISPQRGALGRQGFPVSESSVQHTMNHRSKPSLVSHLKTLPNMKTDWKKMKPDVHGNRKTFNTWAA